MPIRKIISSQDYVYPVKEVVSITRSEKSLLQDLVDTAHEEQQICLSALRIGSSKRIAVVKESPDDSYVALVNPKILDGFGSKVVQEACSSSPEGYKNTLRARMVLIEYQGVSGEVNERIFSDFASYAIQIELDMLDRIEEKEK
jgi:peptide deformylase